MKLSQTLKLCALLCACLMMPGTAPAQEAPEKDLLVVELFARNRTVPRAYSEALRGQVLTAFEYRGRFRIGDAANNPGAFDAGDEIAPLTAGKALAEYLQARTPDMLRAGARYAVNGAVIDYKFEHIMLPGDSKHPPIPGFRSTFIVLLSACDYHLGQMLGQEAFTVTADAPVAEDADHAAIASLASKLTFYIDRNFHIETTILELCPPEGRKQVVKQLYIHAGREMGVSPGDTFNVYEEVPIGGVATRQLVGRIRVNDAQNATVARCKITKGETEIADAFRNGRPLWCVSDTKALFY